MLLGFLDQQDFKSSKIWIGINDGKVEGTYVYDNTVEAITYENFAKDSAPNSEERGMALIYTTFAKRHPAAKNENNHMYDEKCTKKITFEFFKNFFTLGSVQMNYPRGDWNRVDRFSPAAVVCAKPLDLV